MEHLKAALILVALANPPEQEPMIEFMRLAECHGKFSEMVLSDDMGQREKLAAFLELRRRGLVPPFDRKWCIERGIAPFRKTKERPT